MQKLALARLVLINPEIIIFDEATSSLDVNSVNSFYTMFSDVFKNCTIIFILHDLNNLIYADRVLLLKNGNVFKEFNNNTVASLQTLEEIKTEIY